MGYISQNRWTKRLALVSIKAQSESVAGNVFWPKQTFKVPVATLAASTGAITFRLRFGVPTASLGTTTYAPVLRWKVGYQIAAATSSLTGLAPSWHSVVKWQIPSTATLAVSSFSGAYRSVLRPSLTTLAIAGIALAWRSVVKWQVPIATQALTGQTPGFRQIITTRYSVPLAPLSLSMPVPICKTRIGIPLANEVLIGLEPGFRKIVRYALPLVAGLALAAQGPSYRSVYRPSASQTQLQAFAPAFSSKIRLAVPTTSLAVSSQYAHLKSVLRPGSNSVALIPCTSNWRGTFRFKVDLAQIVQVSHIPSWSVTTPGETLGRSVQHQPPDRPLRVNQNGVKKSSTFQAGPRPQSAVLSPLNPDLSLSERTLAGDYMSVVQFAKDPDERLTLELNFNKRLNGRTITSATVSITQLSGTVQAANDVASMLDGAAVSSPSTSWVTQRVKGGALGCSYLIKLKATLSDGDILVGSTQLNVQIGA